MKHFFPHKWRQALKRRLFVVRDMTTRLQVLKRAGFLCTGAIDAGAYLGDWTREFWCVFPQVPVLMVEPQPSPQHCLRKIASSVSSSEVIQVALSDQCNVVMITLKESNSAICNNALQGDSSVLVNAITLDAVLAARPSFSPNLLKLDLQGHELRVLKGAGDQLSRFEVIICEMSLISIDDAPPFAEVNCFFENHGFHLYDVIPQYDRPLDGALWQIDAFYVHRTSGLIASKSWI